VDRQVRDGTFSAEPRAGHAMDLLVVPTIGFDLLYALVIIRLQRRDPVWINGVFSHRTVS
jgi:hypothetical protein